MSTRTLVTAALPYANGSIHIGHLVEYTQADIYVRALKRLGREALYICASDAHGTPIELNAGKLGVKPEELVARFHAEHQRDFNRFDIRFDHFGITHSDANRKIVEEVYKTLRQRGMLDEREIDGNWCEQDQRFLPDRFIRGTCPKCNAADQYGDVCEACGATYAPHELKGPRCALCGKPPVVKRSEHVFFKLSAPENVAFLRRFIDSGALQPDVANYVRTWLDAGLRDWDISRDGPYFGFAIPDKPGKFFYVWLDAPLGYAGATAEWAAAHGQAYAELWQSEQTRIEHIIGKDIVYFHTLFWPALLNAVGYNIPARIQVHGMLTVDGEKMSKTRGTFINAAVFADHLEPQALRYYYACKLSAQTDDLDLALDEFVTRVNAELVNKHANLFSRCTQFLSQKLDGRLGELPFTAAEAQQPPTGDGSMLDLARRVVESGRRIEALYPQLELSQVMRELCAIADVGNEFMQTAAPWTHLSADPERARTICTFAANVCHALAMYLWPVVPRFAEGGARSLGVDLERMDAGLLFAERARPIGGFERLFERIDKKAVAAVLEASKASLGKSQTAAVAPAAEPIDYAQFSAVDLRLGLIREAARVPKSNKLIQLKIDLGEAELRQVVAGIAEAYAAEELVGKNVIVVANLKAAKLMGVESRGMVLAAGKGKELTLLGLDRSAAPGTKVS